MHDIFIAVIVGIVDGVTEFLPVSSTGHMILVEDLLGFHGESASVFTVFIQLGAILSVAFLYREKYLKLMQPKNWFQKPAGLSIWHVAAGIVPVGLIGFLAHGMIKRHLFSSFTVIIGLVLGALLMLAAEKSNRRTETTDVEQMTLKQACPLEYQGAQCAFKDSMIHGILQFTLRIAFRCVLHRCENQEIRC